MNRILRPSNAAKDRMGSAQLISQEVGRNVNPGLHNPRANVGSRQSTPWSTKHINTRNVSQTVYMDRVGQRHQENRFMKGGADRVRGVPCPSS
jgi:hypothetical protein